MRNKIILVSLCSLMVSCSTLKGGDGASPETGSEGVVSLPVLSPASEVPMPQEPADMGQAHAEAQTAQHEESRVDALNEQRSTAELDAAAPETSGVDTFYASGQQPSEATPVLSEVATPSMTLPEKLNPADYAAADSYEEPQAEKPAFKKSKKISRKAAKISKHNKKKIAKSKKSKKDIAKHSKKSGKKIAKKSNSECKKITKNPKKHSKREIAMCKAENKKITHKSNRIGKLARSNR